MEWSEKKKKKREKKKRGEGGGGGGGEASHYENEHKASLIFTAPYFLSFNCVSSIILLCALQGSENILTLTVYEYTSVKSHYEYTSVKSHNSYHSTLSADMQVSSYTTVTVCHGSVNMQSVMTLVQWYVIGC